MENALAVANFFVDKSITEKIDLTPMKLVKLSYLSYGWYIGLMDCELFNEDIQAWKYGPVIPSVYYKFRKYGSYQIKEKAEEDIFENLNGLFDDPVRTYPEVQPNLHPFLTKIWDKYKKYDGIYLSALTHKEGTPWHVTYHKLGGKDNPGVKIPDYLIKSHFKQLANGGSKSTPIS